MLNLERGPRVRIPDMVAEFIFLTCILSKENWIHHRYGVSQTRIKIVRICAFNSFKGRQRKGVFDCGTMTVVSSSIDEVSIRSSLSWSGRASEHRGRTHWCRVIASVEVGHTGVARLRHVHRWRGKLCTRLRPNDSAVIVALRSELVVDDGSVDRGLAVSGWQARRMRGLAWWMAVAPLWLKFKINGAYFWIQMQFTENAINHQHVNITYGFCVRLTLTLVQLYRSSGICIHLYVYSSKNGIIAIQHND